MKLLIVESPAKAKTISKYLDNKYTVKASVGHVRDLPKSNKDAIDIEGGFIPRYVVSAGKENVVEEIQSLAKKADEILLATDPDREGEAIAWHLAQLINTKGSKHDIKRVVYHEITKDAILEAIAHPRKIDEHLREAQEARRVLDRLVGYDLSGLIWKKVRYGLSAGRVQSPALRIIMEREREIRAFNAETFWVITADVKSKKGDAFILTCVEEPRDRKKVDEILKTANNEAWKVKSITETKAKRSPRAPFITSTLQQTASSRLGFTPARTMMTAQKLYEQGHITYMRTDSTTLSKQALEQSLSTVKKLFGPEHHELRTYAKKSKNAQEAHEAIRPTNLSVKSAGNTPEQKKLYRLIWSRTLASQMKDAQILRTKVTAQIGDGSIPDFSINGSRILYEGWLLADPDARSEDVELPALVKDEIISLTEINALEKETQPPSRYSEAGLVKELEKRGIGRPSTYASTIQTLVNRQYVEKEGRSLIPTDTGDVVSSFLENNFEHYISDNFTAELEDQLDDIASGTREYKKTLTDFYLPFKKEVASKENIEKLTNLGPADKKHKCPKCGKAMVIKLGRGGKFLSCATFPDCDGALTLEGLEIKKDEPIGIYPETGQPIFVLTGRFGPYVQVGEAPDKKDKKKEKLKRASIPKGFDIENITEKDALKFLSIPRELGVHPKTNETITASIGRFGPYIVHDTDFRSLKEDDVYTITLERALEILSEPKKTRKGGRFAKKKTERTKPEEK